MIRAAPLFKAYLFIKQNRFHKKKKMNKMALELMVDKTTGAYLVLIGIYVFVSFFIFGDYIHEFDNTFKEIDDNLRKGFWLILTALPIRYIFNSFRDPGVLFSSSEYQLAMLPYSRNRIWLLTVIEKWIRQLFIYTILGILIILITPISASLIVSYMVMLLVYDMIMTVLQWKLFQTKFLIKLGWLLVVVLINALGALFALPMIGFVLVAVLIGINFVLIRSLFAQVKWEKVTEYSDYRIWNMRFIASASKVKFKRNKKYGIFANTKRRKKPFAYKQDAIHDRLWQLYMAKNMQLIFQFIGALFLLLVVLAFINNQLFHVGIAFTVYAYTSVTASFFNNRFQDDIVQVLPWDLARYRKSFFKWVVYGTVPLLIPIITFHIIHATIWVPFQLSFYCCTFLYLYHTKLDKSMGMLSKRPDISNSMSSMLGFVFLIVMGFSSHYPYLVLSLLFILALLKRQKR